MTKTEKPVKIDLWYTSANELLNSHIDFKEWAKISDIFKNQVEFQPRTMTHKCLGCSEDEKKKLCIANGKYCPFLPNNKP